MKDLPILLDKYALAVLKADRAKDDFLSYAEAHRDESTYSRWYRSLERSMFRACARRDALRTEILKMHKRLVARKASPQEHNDRLEYAHRHGHTFIDN